LISINNIKVFVRFSQVGERSHNTQS
jgi:hypothetical protein